MSRGESTRFCHHCGARVELAEAQFCSSCGKQLIEIAPSVTRIPAPSTPSARVEQSQKRRQEQQSPRQRTTQSRRFHLLRLSTIFGLFDIIAIFVLAAGYAVWRLKPETTSCELLEPPASHTVVDSREPLQGEIKGFSVLEAGQTYTVAAGRSLTVPDGATLLIQPGVRLVFEQGAALDVYGRLHACGTGRETILFTSSRDLDDSGASRPKAGDWAGIRFFQSSDERSMIGNVRIRYAGDQNHGAIHLTGASPRIAGVTIADSAWFPISLDADADPALGGQIAMENVPYQAIEVRKSTLTHNQEWADTDRVYVVTGHVTVGANATLSIRPGVAVKFASGVALVVEGRLQAVGELGGNAQAIIFTSIRDDEVRGDTDLAAVDPEAGDWLGIVFKESSQGSVLRGVTVRYAGNAQYGVGALHLEAASPEIVGNEIGHSAAYAISADVNSFPTIQGNHLADIALGNGLALRGSELTAAGSYQWDNKGVDMVRVVVDRITVGGNATLTIAPGTIVKFTNQGTLDVSGFLRAEGGDSDDTRIVFTSVHDDDFGGDTDGTTDPQASRDWKWIILRGSDPNTIIRRAVIRYAGVWLENASPQLLDDEIQDSKTYPISTDPGSDPLIQRVAAKRNLVNGIEIRAGELATRGEWVWDNTKVALVRVVTGRLIVGSETALVLRPSTVVKFANDGHLYVKGALRVEGQEQQQVVLTSWRDDHYGGDIDGGAAQPKPGEWQGVAFDGNSNDAASSLQHAIVRYAATGLSLADSSPAIRNVRVDHCLSQGLVCDNRSEPLLERVALEDNGEAGTNCPGWGGTP